MSPRLLRWVMNFWPPYLGAGIRVRSIAPDWSEAVVELHGRIYNRNYVGVAPGRGRVSVRFQLPEETVDSIRKDAAGGDKVLPQFECEIRDRAGALVARAQDRLCKAQAALSP